jgi:hypothetical protein
VFACPQPASQAEPQASARTDGTSSGRLRGAARRQPPVLLFRRGYQPTDHAESRIDRLLIAQREPRSGPARAVAERGRGNEPAAAQARLAPAAQGPRARPRGSGARGPDCRSNRRSAGGPAGPGCDLPVTTRGPRDLARSARGWSARRHGAGHGRVAVSPGARSAPSRAPRVRVRAGPRRGSWYGHALRRISPVPADIEIRGLPRLADPLWGLAASGAQRPATRRPPPPACGLAPHAGPVCVRGRRGRHARPARGREPIHCR